MPPDQVACCVLRNPVSAGTHLVWCAWAVFVALFLWRLARGDRYRQFCVAVFGVSMVLLYGASGTYHALTVDEPTLHYFRLLDYSAIYLLIAGTYTPLFGLVLHGRTRLVLLTSMWLAAVVGIACKWLLPAPPYGLTVGVYIAMGWMGLLPMGHLVRALGWRAMGWAILGGLLYTAGGLCDALHWPVLLPHVVTSHEVLHVFDMGGTAVHVYFVVRFLLPYRPGEVYARPSTVAAPVCGLAAAGS
jgi:hemolysin III